MPQADLKYTDNISLDISALFSAVEDTINLLDSSAGACKSRAYPSNAFLHTHILLNVSILRKPHRDSAFMKTLLKALETTLESYVPPNCYYAIQLDFSSEYYVTKTSSLL